ncbi:YgjV family protein [Salinisphaera japonica]|nr:YgjV family protein [Salinisphaera japonica]
MDDAVFDDISWAWWAGQGFGLAALVLCVLGFASRHDERLFLRLLLANVAFTLQFALLGSWVAAGITALIVLRIQLVRRYKGSWLVMSGMLVATLVVALPGLGSLHALWPLAAGLIGTLAMFMFEGIPMRWLLAVAAFCWVMANLLVGSIGGTAAEILILVTNLVTIGRLMRARRSRVS